MTDEQKETLAKLLENGEDIEKYLETLGFEKRVMNVCDKCGAETTRWKCGNCGNEVAPPW